MIKINESIKPNGGDGKNYFMFYAGPGYPSRKEVEKFAKENGCTTIWFGSDESYGLKGMYNGDTFVVCKDINKLPSNYKEDAKKHGELIESLDEKYLDDIGKKEKPNSGAKVYMKIVKESDSINEAKKPKYWNSVFTTNVIDDYKSGKLKMNNIDKWETEYNGGIKPNPSLGTKEILKYYIETGKDPRNESLNINENKSVKLTDREIRSIEAAIGSDARAGINDARDLQKTLDKSSNGIVNFTNGDIEYLEYWNDLITYHSNSPKVKYMDNDLKSALMKIYN